mgnify:CR=1 FL=1
MAKVFSFRADWHQDDRAKPLVRQYQTALDSVLQLHPELLGCVAHCKQCGIRFLTHPRNAGRRDLRCPFGCRQHHRRQRCNQRSSTYYRTPDGRRKKKRLNARRQRKAERSADTAPQQVSQPDGTPKEPPAEAQPQPTAELRLEGVVLRESDVARSPVLPHVRMVIRLIEGVQLSLREVVSLLRRAMRQRSIARRRRTDYVVGFLQQHPP